MHGPGALTGAETSSPAHNLPVRSLFGVDIAAVTMAEAIALVERAITARGRLHIGVVNAAKLVNMRRQPALAAAVHACDVIFADGMSVVWASRLLGCALPERVAGIDLMEAMLARGDRAGWRVYCLGAEARVLADAMRSLRASYPGVQFVGSHHGYFSADEERAVVLEIASRRPDILLVGMTSPRKEVFLERWHDVLDVSVCHGVGGSFDIVGGKSRRAPVVWQRLGLEWLYRVIQEPGRMWRRYLVTNSLFLQMLGAEIVRKIARAPSKGWRRA
jgi:N-acetylglucosaminyldiphosphoundecaprenol N-acetyl-beta-D-mannosaminyltransferase